MISIAYRKSNRSLIYRKSRGVSNEWKWVAWKEKMTTWTFHVLKAWNSYDLSTVVDESTHRKYDGSTSTVTSRSIRVDSTTSPTHLRSYSRNIFYVSCKSTSGMTGRHQLRRVVRFDKICNPLSWPLAEYFLSVLQIDFWCDGSTLT